MHVRPRMAGEVEATSLAHYPTKERRSLTNSKIKGVPDRRVAQRFKIFQPGQWKDADAPLRLHLLDISTTGASLCKIPARGRGLHLHRMRRSFGYLHAFETGSELRVGLTRWIGYYNADRPHSGLAGQTPDEPYGVNAIRPLSGLAPTAETLLLAA